MLKIRKSSLFEVNSGIIASISSFYRYEIDFCLFIHHSSFTIISMLSIFILFSIASAFSRKAHDKNRNRYGWGTIGVVTFFGSQFIGGIIVALINADLLNDQGTVTIIGLISGIIGTGTAYYVLHKLPDPTEIVETDSDLLDSNL